MIDFFVNRNKCQTRITKSFVLVIRIHIFESTSLSTFRFGFINFVNFGKRILLAPVVLSLTISSDKYA